MKNRLFLLTCTLLMIISLFCSCTQKNSNTTATDGDANATSSDAATLTDAEEKETLSPDVSESTEETQVSEMDTAPAQISVCFAEDMEEQYENAINFTAEESEYQTVIAIMTDKEISDFKFNSLLMTDVDDNGNITFDTTERYSVQKLTPDTPFIVTLTFYGDSPEYGFSYTDANGETVRYTLTLSGMDGSPVIASY